MKLTTAQKITLKNDILAKQASAQPLFGVTDENIIAAYYNAASSSSAWRSDTPITDIQDAITWTNFTPNDSVPVVDNSTQTTSLASIANGIQFLNRILVVQTKQINMTNTVTGRTVLDTTKANIRADLQDMVVKLPTGASGALLSAGGANGATILAACTRLMNRVEALFGTVDATTGTTTAKLLVVEGSVTAQDISDAINGL